MKKIYSVSGHLKKEFLTNIPTNFAVVHLVTATVQYLPQTIHCLTQHQPNTRLTNW